MLPINDPVAKGLLSVFNPQVIDGIFYFFDRLDEYEKKFRYDDNRRRFMEQAIRLYEQGDMTKEQLKAVVDLLPERPVEVKSVEVRPPQPPTQPKSDIDVNELLKKIMEQ